jgi:hypothetical protein
LTLGTIHAIFVTRHPTFTTQQQQQQQGQEEPFFFFFSNPPPPPALPTNPGVTKVSVPENFAWPVKYNAGYR